MAELPSAPKERTLTLIQGAPPKSGEDGTSALGLGAFLPGAKTDGPESSPEESLAKFKALGAKAKKTGKLPLDANKIAAALQNLTAPHSATATASPETIGRAIQLPTAIHEAIISLVSSRRDVPGFVRDAIKSVGESRVIPKTIIDQASEISRARRAGKGRVSVTVNMDPAIYGVVEVLQRRTKLSDKAVMEACTVLYLQAVMNSQQA